MPPIFQPLIRILALEIHNGCRNDSHVGGLAELAKLWEDNAIAANGEERQRIQRVAKGLSYYHRVPLDDRPHYVRQLFAIVESEDFVEALPLGAADNLEELLQRKEYLRSEIAKLDDYQQQLQAHLEELVQQKEHLRFEVYGLDAQRQQVLTSLRDISQQAEELRSEIIELEAQRLELQNELDKLKDDQEVLRSEHEQMQTQRAELEAAIAALGVRNSQLEESKTQLEAEVNNLDSQHQQVTVNLRNTLRQEAERLQSEVESLGTQQQGLLAEIDRLKDNQATLHSQYDELQNRKVELELVATELKGQNTQLQERKTGLESDIESANAKIAGLNDLVDNLQAQADEIRQKTASRLEQVTRVIGRRIELEAEIGKLEGELDQFKREQESLLQQIKEREKEKNIIAAKPLFARGADLTNRDTQLTNEISKLNEQRVLLETEIGNLKGELDSRKPQRESIHIDSEINT